MEIFDIKVGISPSSTFKYKNMILNHYVFGGKSKIKLK